MRDALFFCQPDSGGTHTEDAQRGTERAHHASAAHIDDDATSHPARKK